MKNTRLKNVIFTAGMAIFTGVLLLGVNAAIGAATPTVDPPGAGVSPTFTGLNVNGNIQNSAGNVSVSDNLAVTGNVDVSGALSADSLITPTISDDSNAVVINDGLIVNGPGASRIEGTFINVNSVLRANNSIVNAANGGAAPVTVNDNFVVTGTSNLQGNVTFDGNIASDEDTLLVNDMLRVGGGLIIDGPQSRFDGEFINVNAILRANNGIINMANGGAAPVTVNDNMVVTGNATINGVARARRFGTVTVRSTVRTNVNTNNDISLNQPCNEGEELLSCGANTFNSDFAWDYNKNFVIKAVYPWTNDTCYGRARNESGVAKKFSVSAVCLDPDL